MDGNGRWAHAHGLPRGEGHRRGVEALRRAVRFAGRRGIRYLTLFSFSSENWSRPDEEIEGLFNLVRIFIRGDLAELNRNGVKVRVIGEREPLPLDIRGLIEEAEASHVAAIAACNLTVAFNYGARDEIVRAARALAERAAAASCAPNAIDHATFERGARHGGDSRSRPHHPHLRRAADQQFPALAGGLCRARLPAGAVAGFRRRAVRGGA